MYPLALAGVCVEGDASIECDRAMKRVWAADALDGVGGRLILLDVNWVVMLRDTDRWSLTRTDEVGEAEGGKVLLVGVAL